MKRPTASHPLALGECVVVPQLPSVCNWPRDGASIPHHLEPGRVVGGLSWVETRTTIYQVRTNRERTRRLGADHASWFEPQEIAA